MFTLSKRSAMQIASEISELIQQHVNIMDYQGYIIASTDVERIGTFHEGAKEVIDKQLAKLVVACDEDYIGSRKGINLPIVVEGDILGVIGMTGEPQQIELYVKIIKKMTEILVVEAYYKEEKLVGEKIRNRYIEEWLLDSSNSKNEKFIKRGAALGIDITLPRRILVISVVDEGRKDDAYEEQRMLDHIEQKLKQVIEEDNCGNILFNNNTEMVCIVAKRSNEEMLLLASRIQRTAQEKYKIIIAIGIDKQVDSYTQMHKAYMYGEKALAAAYGSSNNKIKFYENINLEIFINEIPSHLKEEFKCKIFNNMTAENIEAAVFIIEKMIACNGSLSLASEHLFMHKNTLQYKLNRIHEQTGYDPRNLKDLPLFYIAVLFYRELSH